MALPRRRTRVPGLVARKGKAIASALLVLSTSWVAFALATGTSAATSTSESYVVPRSQFNITDRNLSFATNMVLLHPAINGSFSLAVSDTLAASPAYAAPTEEAELGIGPGPNPAGGDETYITPLFILQTAATGFLRLQYIPFAMNDTLGFVVYSGTPEASSPSPFVHHVIELQFVQTSTLVRPYQPTLPYGQANGNLTLRLDGEVLAGPYPVDWATLSAFYGYGLTTGRFVGGAVYANVTSTGSPSRSATVGSLPLAVLEGIFTLATLAGAAGLVGGTRYLRRDR